MRTTSFTIRLLAAAVVVAAGACSGDRGTTASDDAAASTLTTMPNDLAPAGLVELADFEPWLGSDPTDTPDPIGDRLCVETASFEDPTAEKHDITCELEGANFATEAPPATDQIVVMTWNVERNYELDAQIELFVSGAVPTPDVLLASEADRGCDRSAGVNGGWELAKALGMNYVFGVEFVEGVRDGLSTPCEHGQAIFSKYPIGNVELFRHINTGTDRYDNPDEPRIGTRVDLEADIAVGDRLVHVVSVHYDDRIDEAEEQARNGQAEVTASRALRHDVPTVVAGDMNTALYFLDASSTSTSSVAAKTFWDKGWRDTHAGIAERITVPFELSGSTVPAVVDLLWVRDDAVTSDPSWCSVEDCGPASDHLPQWVTLHIG